MKIMKKTALALFTVCILVLCTLLCAANISAAEITDSGECGDNVTWTLYDNGEFVIEGTGEMGDIGGRVSIPWFEYRSSIQTVTVLDGVTSVAAFSFDGCKNLKSVNLGNTVTSIGYSSFVGCESLTGITFPNSVTRIIQNSFQGCTGLTTVTIPENVTLIGSNAFKDCVNLTGVTVLSRDAKFGTEVFAGTSRRDFTLYGYKKSTAITYARNKHYFVALETNITGDVNGDSSLDISDAIALFRHTMMPDIYSVLYTRTMDFNKDGALDINDAAHLFRHTMMPDIYPID